MNTKKLGIDIGSTTAKVVLLEGEKILYSKYKRHLSRVRETTREMLADLIGTFGDLDVSVTVSGSAGMGLAESADLGFVQEVYATAKVVERLAPETSVVIELGGEDAKVIFFDGGISERMNGSCAGGTGAFIDQMAVLLNMSADEMDRESLKAERLYPIASRCGVFAKTDIQPLLNQGAKKSDIAASIYQAVVNQTLTGLVAGRKIVGRVMFLGGPLYYCEGLRRRFYETLNLTEENAIFPEYALYSVARGAAMSAEGRASIKTSELIKRIDESASHENHNSDRLPPLFESEDEYRAFRERHERASVPHSDIDSYSGDAWLGIDCGSTTTKLVLIDRNKSILYSYYSSNKGDPVSVVREELLKFYRKHSDRIKICGTSVTGYGEELIKNAFRADEGVVETIAHYTAAKHFSPDVDFILDIGGQDIKCFKIKSGAIDSIMLNEACSSGCGSFIETFAKAMGCEIADFARLGIFAPSPVNLGTRCTVFMNSSVKQSQKDGASIEDISAGLSVSVVKNAIYKVIRAANASELGRRIVVQGGTFYNDAVLRAFEKEICADVVRPSIAGLMGAYGAALHVMNKRESTVLSYDEIENFYHESTTALCGGCENRCHLTVNKFRDGRKFISGNRCERALGVNSPDALPNMYEWKRNYIKSLEPRKGKRKKKIGIPLALSSFELFPMWHAFFSELGFEVKFSGLSTRRTYEKGQFTIPSDTACYPAKIMHGHVLELADEGCDVIFYPGLTYNIDEGASDNHYNCPIVAYYAELLSGNVERLRDLHFSYPYLSLDNEKALAKTVFSEMKNIDRTVTKKEVSRAAKAAFAEYGKYRQAVEKEGERVIKTARERGARILILAGRPYHIDPEISHGIDKLCASLGFAVVTEDAVAHLSDVQYVKVLDQWTFHARLYRAAAFAGENSDTELVQLVSFGCGVDAITTDEVRDILEKRGKFYTQIKIDEITNLGAVKIRLRSLIGALDERR